MCNVRSVPGLDGISNGTLLVLLDRSSCSRVFLLALYNRMFLESSFLVAWRDTLVSFVPKSDSSGFRPFSLTSVLCKIFERLIHRQLEYLAERNQWTPGNQFDFSWGSDPGLLFIVYGGLVRACLEWGSPLFQYAGMNALRILDRIQYEALRMVLGCLRSTRIAILLSEVRCVTSLADWSRRVRLREIHTL